MKKLFPVRIIAFLLLVLSPVTFGGCVYLVVGSIGAIGGYAVSEDTVQGTIERSYDTVWEQSVSVANIMGRITKESDAGGRIDAIVNNCKVTITVQQFTGKLVRISVKARKSFFPNIPTAQDVYIKIVSSLGE